MVTVMPVQSSLTDSLGRVHDYLRISLTGKCNLNCTYCRPSSGTFIPGGSGYELSDDELLRLVSLLAGLGVRKVRLTGGEPLLRSGIVSLVERLATLEGIETVALTTNGTLLTDKLEHLSNAGLRRLNISLDSLDAGRLRNITGRDCLSAVRKAIDTALDIERLKVKLNTVVVCGVNDDELAAFVELTRDKPLDVRFIEYMPFGKNRWQPDLLVGWEEMAARITDQYPLVEESVEGVARMYRVAGYKGRVGFIAPLTGCFCGTCSRLRLTSDGRLRLCLHNALEIPLANLLRGGASDQELIDAVKTGLRKKAESHGRRADMAQETSCCSSMAAIGG